MRAILLCSLAILLASCMSQPELGELVEDMVVQTNFDPDASFSSYSTYTLPMDTIGLISNASNANALTNAYAKAVTAAVKRNMDSYNRQRVAFNQNPDLGVNVYVVNDLSVFQTVNYSGFGYPGYGYGGYYGYRGYYGYPYVSTYATNQAILVIEFADLKNQGSKTDPEVVWVANMGDLITSLDPDRKVIEAIDQAFKQSEYLKK